MAIKGFTKEDVARLTICLAEFKEYRKIGDCLSYLDELISAQVDKIDALKLHKKGVIQQLFPREGETVPRLRYSDFQNAERWRHKKSGQIFSSRN